MCHVLISLSATDRESPRRGPCCETGEEALERVSFHKSTVKRAAISQCRIIGAAYGATLFTLQRNKPKFMSVVPGS